MVEDRLLIERATPPNIDDTDLSFLFRCIDGFEPARGTATQDLKGEPKLKGQLLVRIVLTKGLEVHKEGLGAEVMATGHRAGESFPVDSEDEGGGVGETRAS